MSVLLYDRPVSAFDFCQAVGGLGARDQRAGNWQMSIKRHERLSAKASVKVNVKTQVALSTGTGANSSVDLHRTNWASLSVSAKKELARRILESQGKNPSANAVNKMVRYGIGLAK